MKASETRYWICVFCDHQLRAKEPPDSCPQCINKDAFEELFVTGEVPDERGN